jgi:transposase InsO family protein
MASGAQPGSHITPDALQRALAKHPAPEIHHSDQDVQYAATAYTQALQDVNVQISTANVGQAWQNGYAKRLIRTIKEEEVDLHPSMYTVYHKSGPQERSLSDRLLGP